MPTPISDDAPLSSNQEMRPSQVTLKTVFTVSFGVTISVVALAAIARATVAIALVGAALTIAVALDRGVRLFEQRGFRRSHAIAVVTLAVLGLVLAFGFTLIPPAIDQGREFVRNAPALIRNARSSGLFRTLDERFHIAQHLLDAERRLPEMLEGAATPILNALGGLLSAVAAAVTIMFLVVFMLIFGERLIQAALSEARIERRPMYEEVLGKIYRSIGGYIGGLTLICTVNALLATTFLAIDRVPFFLPLGIIAGLSSLVPYAGPLVVGTAISLVALFTKGTVHGVASAIYFVSYGQIEGNILAPLVFRRTVHVNPLVVTLSILFLGEIGGVLGAIAAVPVVATLQIVLREILRKRREQLALAHENATV
jgi:predicted PurR-regulated permease PerM